MKEKTKMSLPMRDRDLFIENKIETDIRYFCNQFNGAKSIGIDLDNLRVQLQKNQEF